MHKNCDACERLCISFHFKWQGLNFQRKIEVVKFRCRKLQCENLRITDAVSVAMQQTESGKGNAMPKAHLLTSATPEAPLSVAAVSVRLGISPSTLRTWERRYGLVVGERTLGAHRRYLPEDVERLAQMVRLIHAGVPTADAAALVLAGQVSTFIDEVSERVAPATPEHLVTAARNGQPDDLVHLLEGAIATDGLVYTWQRLIEPALELIRSSDEGEIPGHAASANLTVAVLRVLTEVSDHRPPCECAEPVKVIVLTDEEHSLAAHVMGVAMQWQGLDVSIMSTGRHGGTTALDRLKSRFERHGASLAVVAGRGTACEQLISGMTSEMGLDVVLVGADTPTILDEKVQRVRTLAAAVEEVFALSRC